MAKMLKISGPFVDECSLTIRSIWVRHSSAILGIAVGLTLVSIVFRLLPELDRLLLSNAYNGAIDLRLRHGEIGRWFAGLPVYADRRHAGYPPASYVLLFPFLGWLGEYGARWLWGALTVAELSLLSILTIRFIGTTKRLEKLLIVLTLFSAYPITVTLGNGQLGIHIFTLFLCAMLLVECRATWRIDVAASVLLIFAATKPSFSAPLYWIVLFALGRLRPIFLVMGSYVSLTAFALMFRPESISNMLHDFIEHNREVIGTSGGAHIAVWMRFIGLSDWTSIASLGLFVALGCWVYSNRRADRWMLLGVSAVVARIWTYHRMYDDLLILFAMLPLARWLRRSSVPDNVRVLGALLFSAAWFSLFIPASTINYPFPWNLPYEIGLPLIWIAMLFFLAGIIHKTQNLHASSPP